MTKHPNASAYIPGDCNINEHERAIRRRVGYVGLQAYVVSLVLLLTLTDWIWWRLLLLIPAFLAAIGFLQASYRFCVYLGAVGRQNAEPGSTPHTVTNEASLRKDRRRAREIKLQALGIAVAATLVTLLLPDIR